MNFVAFSYFDATCTAAFVFFILTVAAAESAIGLAILVLLFRATVPASAWKNSTSSKAKTRLQR